MVRVVLVGMQVQVMLRTSGWGGMGGMGGAGRHGRQNSKFRRAPITSRVPRWFKGRSYANPLETSQPEGSSGR